MKFLKTAIAALLAATYAGGVQAQDSTANRSGAKDSGVYAGVGVSAFVTNPENINGGELFAVEAKLGYDFNRYFGVEAQGSIGLNTESEDVPFGMPEPATLSRKLDYSVAAFAVARLPVSEKFDIFARGGVHNTQSGKEFDNGQIIDSSETKTGVALGAGAQFNFDKKNAIRADYTYLDGTNAETLSLGYIRKF